MPYELKQTILREQLFSEGDSYIDSTIWVRVENTTFKWSYKLLILTLNRKSVTIKSNNRSLLDWRAASLCLACFVRVWTHSNPSIFLLNLHSLSHILFYDVGAGLVLFYSVQKISYHLCTVRSLLGHTHFWIWSR